MPTGAVAPESPKAHCAAIRVKGAQATQPVAVDAWPVPRGAGSRGRSSSRVPYSILPHARRRRANRRVWHDGPGVGGRRRAASQPPLRHSQVEGQAVMAAVAAVFAVAMLLGGAGWLARQVADRHRSAAWDAEWRATGPKWSRHR
jgi:hypothetical protein